MNTATDLLLRNVGAADLDAICAIDAARAGEGKAAYWQTVVEAFGSGSADRVALVATIDGVVGGFLFGEVRAWEFGSERCGWIFSVAVRPGLARRGVASRLCEEAVRRFGAAGVHTVRTMVRRDDIPMQSLFRSLGYRAGPFSEMETRVPIQAQRAGAST